MYLTLRNLDVRWQNLVVVCGDAVALLEAKERCVEAWREPLRARLDALFGAMAVALEPLDPEERAAAISFHRRLVEPYFVESPYCRRTDDDALGMSHAAGGTDIVHAGAEGAPSPLGALLGAYTLGGPRAAGRGGLDWLRLELDQ
ncbi:MAG: hypothetical protein V4850_07735 [Myxococcota bacterium]